MIKIFCLPHILKERYAKEDFIENHNVCLIGSGSKNICEFIKKIHGPFPNKFLYVSSTEAEIIKYYNNIYATTLVTLANNFYELCNFTGSNYDLVKEAMIHRDHINNAYIDCNENLRGF